MSVALKNEVSSFPEFFPHFKEKVDWQQIEILPSPVKKYFTHVLKRECPLIKATQFTQEGRLRDFGNKDWMKFRAGEQISAAPRSFDWQARMNVLGRLSMQIADGYVNGRGKSRANFMHIVPVKSIKSSKELAEASLQRYLAECVFAPTMLLPEAGVEWFPLTEDSALARLSDHGISVSLEFHFAPNGEVKNVYTSSRWSYVDGKFEALPWKGTFMGSYWLHGCKVPRYAEVAWKKNGEWYTVWQAKWLSQDFMV